MYGLKRFYPVIGSRHHNGNYAQSARLLGISRNALVYRAQKYGITNTMQRRIVG
ncbi:MAG: hypothetical protein NTZ45_02370 [Methylococcales bacterium]|nr:hypothetical protein [Methylococcales bacterium]